jgi:polysaccharide export outer membrane protein
VAPLPRELNKVSLPTYQIEPPDILQINAIRILPRRPYKIEPLDAIVIDVTPTDPTKPISGMYVVDPEGTVNLGFSYGTVEVEGLTLKEAKGAIEKHLKALLKKPVVTVALGQTGARQQIQGQHLVRPDGTIGLGIYGSVHVAGLTLDEARERIENQLARFLRKPQIALDVFAYNSKVYYVITDGGGQGEQVVSVPLKGNETVLDAISQINGLPPVSSKDRIWVARPAPAGNSGYQVLPVDWRAVTMGGGTDTNYQIFPGDRIYVNSSPLVKLDTTLARIITPIERLFGVTLLGTSTVQTLNHGITNTAGGVGR